MSSVSSKELQAGYKAVATAPSPDMAKANYADFHRLLDETKPPVETVIETSLEASEVVPLFYAVNLEVIAKVRRGELNGMRYFRGPGIIMTGDSQGQIVAADYQAEDDFVADQYPGYQYIALRKLGLAAMIGRAKLPLTPNRESYLRVQEVLEELGVASAKTPHHLGYVVAKAGRDEFMTASASGMMPSAMVGIDMRVDHKDLIKSGRRRGWYRWPGDEAAGLHDLVAAQSVVTGFLNPSYFRNNPASDAIQPVQPSDFGPDVNIH